MLFQNDVQWAVIIGVLPTMVITYSGIGLALFVAATCGLLARRRELSARRYALIGGIYSALMLAPGVYLIVTLAGRRPPTVLVILAYLVVLTLWVVGSVAMPGLYAWSEIGLPWGSHEPYLPWESPELYWVVHAVTTVGFIAANVAAMLVWGWWLIWRRPSASSTPLPHVGYMVPFALVPTVLLVFIVMGHLTETLR